MTQDNAESELDLWQRAKLPHGHQNFTLGPDWSLGFRNDPTQLVFALSRYKFAAKMLDRNRNILELGCGEGIGTPILSEFASAYTGIDSNASAIDSATTNWGSKSCRFVASNPLGSKFGEFDAVVSIGILENIDPHHNDLFFDTIGRNLTDDGICIIGTLNESASNTAIDAGYPTQTNGHDADRLNESMSRIFNNVFIFGMNDEVMHTGFTPMAHHLFALGCYKNSNGREI